MKKRSVALMLSAAMMVTLFAGCGKKQEAESETQPVQTETVQIETESETQPETEAETEETLADGMMRSYLTGEIIPVEDGADRPVALMIDNVPEALPQCGIGQASILYEAVVESDLTRLMAVFDKTSDIEKVGPLRSCRHNYLDFAYDESAVYGHFGWSYAAEERINNEGLHTLKFMQGGINSVYYRDNSRTAPHNVFTTGEMLEKAFSVFDADTKLPEGFEGRLSFNTAGDVVHEEGQTAGKVDIALSSKSHLEYDEANQVYTKFEYGHEHMDDVTGEALTFKNIIVEKAVYTQYNGDILKDIAVVGSGDGMYISDGKAINITWKKDSATDRTKYYMEDGTELKLNVGKTYIAVVPTDTAITLSEN